MITNIDQAYGPMLEKYFSGGSGPIILISPFISLSALKLLLANAKDVIIVTSWRKDHLRAGVSTLDLYPLCKENGWTLFINSNLHAKIYLNGFKDCYLGSANCTERALYSDNGNIECLRYVKFEDRLSSIEINMIISRSKLVDDSIYEQYLDWYDELTDNSIDICDDLELNPTYSLFDLPATSDPESLFEYCNGYPFNDNCEEIKHDLSLFGSLNNLDSRDEFLSQCKINFFNNKFIKLISEQITHEGVSFGFMSSFIHNICTDVPVPYRRDVKFFVNNIFSWFVKLDPDTFEIQVPKHSEILIRR